MDWRRATIPTMPDPIALLAGAFETAKRLWDIAEKIKDADTKGLIADLRVALADIKTEVAALKETNLGLEAEVRRLQEKPNIRANIEPRDGVYYLKTPEVGRSNGPYCPRCLDVVEKLIPLAEQPHTFRSFGKWRCPECTAHYGQ
jgi:hypothetical protein